jgi:hypothetical protein
VIYLGVVYKRSENFYRFYFSFGFCRLRFRASPTIEDCLEKSTGKSDGRATFSKCRRVGLT